MPSFVESGANPHLKVVRVALTARGHPRRGASQHKVLVVEPQPAHVCNKVRVIYRSGCTLFGDVPQSRQKSNPAKKTIPIPPS